MCARAECEMERLGMALRETLRRRAPTPAASCWRAFAFGWLFGDLGHFRAAGAADVAVPALGRAVAGAHLGILRLLRLRDMERLLPHVPGAFCRPTGQKLAPGRAAQVFAGCIMSTAFAPTTEAHGRVARGVRLRGQVHRRARCAAARCRRTPATWTRARELALAEPGGVRRWRSADRGQRSRLRGHAQALRAVAARRRRARGVRRPGEGRVASSWRTGSRFSRRASSERTVAIQDACHLLHAQRVRRAPQAAAGDSGLELREIAEREICCGSAGIYNVTHPR